MGYGRHSAEWEAEPNAKEETWQFWLSPTFIILLVRKQAGWAMICGLFGGEWDVICPADVDATVAKRRAADVASGKLLGIADAIRQSAK